MDVTISRINEAVHLEGKNEDGLRVLLDGSPAIGGENKGVRPMEMLLISLGSCSSMDVLSILTKMKQEVTDYTVEVHGDREPDTVPSLFTKIHVHYRLWGDLDEKKVARAIDLSMGTYCSVTKMLEKAVEITHDFVIEK